MLSIRLFGKLDITSSGGTAIPVRGAKMQGLVAYLALNIDMPPSRDRLMTLFWGDRFTSQARQSLRQAVAKLRKLLDDGDRAVLRADADTVGLDPGAVEVDIDRFARLAADPAPEAAVAAAALMRAPLLDGLYGQRSEFDDWIASERQRVATLALGVFERAVEWHLHAGDSAKALRMARQLVAVDPLRDASQMVLIRLLAQAGERAAAIQQFNAHAARLRAELDVAPGPAIQRLMAEIRGESVGLAAGPESLAGPDAGAPRGSRAATVHGCPSIAVIPFGSLSPEPGQEQFLATLSQDIATNLSRFKWLDVRAGPDHGGGRLTATDMSTLGRQLDLNYVVHGALRMHGRTLRLTVQLAEPRTARYLWVCRYDRCAPDPMDVQDELAATIAASVEAEVERLAGRAARQVPFEAMNAWDCYHRGLAIQYEFSAATNSEAQRHFRRAVELDPCFAAGYARLSYALVISAIYFDAENVEALVDEAVELGRTACRLDPDDAIGRFALGRAYLARRDYELSLAELRTAVDLNPGLAQAHCALGDSLAYAGELEKALPCFEEAVRLSPADPYRWAFLCYYATALLFMRRFEEAAHVAAQAEAVPNSHYWATAVRASSLGNLGKEPQAAEAVAELRKRRPGITLHRVRERLFYLRDPEQMGVYLKGLRRAGLR